MALAERMAAARYPDLVDHYTYVMAGDGCLMEGVSQEAIDLAGHLKLSRLIVLWDDNRITIDGSTALSTSTDQSARFRASGWKVLTVEGHTHAEIADALAEARGSDLPVLIACRTVIGKGAPNKAGPNLHDIVGRKTASLEGFTYSDAMKKLGEEGHVWTPEEIDHFIADPKAMVAGTKMAFAGVKKPEERADIVAYLQSLSAN